MFWIILLCHFIADYPLQTDAMVVAKKNGLQGLIMHIAMHFLTMLVAMCAILSIEISIGISLAFVISCFHFVIDYWKNILAKLRPTWIVFGYIQDQLLHYLSILLITYLWQKLGWSPFLEIANPLIIYAIGFVLVTHFWFITELVINHKNSPYTQWMSKTMWSRMMSRGIVFSTMIVGFNLWLIAVLAGAIIVGWNDLDVSNRTKTLAFDIAGATMLIVITHGLLNALY